jgi:hypothetical protein
MPGNSCEAEEKIWKDLDQVFRDGGYVQLEYLLGSVLVFPGKKLPLPSGFRYATPIRGIENEENPAGTVQRLG